MPNGRVLPGGQGGSSCTCSGEARPHVWAGTGCTRVRYTAADGALRRAFGKGFAPAHLPAFLPPAPPARSAREAEVVSLKQELAEKDGKLKAARTDALESKMRLQQKDAELKEAYAQLSEAVRDRSAMRSQLAQVRARSRRV